MSPVCFFVCFVLNIQKQAKINRKGATVNSTVTVQSHKNTQIFAVVESKLVLLLSY